jgi:hypothetical protein
MVDGGRLTALEEEYASTAERVAALEARWQDLAAQYVAWRDHEPGNPELSIVEDREFPDGYAVLRAQYEVDRELFELVKSMREMEGEIFALRSQSVDDIPAVDTYFVPAPVPVPSRERRRTVPVVRIAAISLGVVALLVATYALTRGGDEQPTVEVGVPAQQTAPITWKLRDAKVVKVAKKQGGGCLKTVQVAVGDGAEHADELVQVRIEGADFLDSSDRRIRLNAKGVGTVRYKTKRCDGNPVNSVHVRQVGDDVNVATKRSR